MGRDGKFKKYYLHSFFIDSHLLRKLLAVTQTLQHSLPPSRYESSKLPSGHCLVRSHWVKGPFVCITCLPRVVMSLSNAACILWKDSALLKSSPTSSGSSFCLSWIWATNSFPSSKYLKENRSMSISSALCLSSYLNIRCSHHVRFNSLWRCYRMHMFSVLMPLVMPQFNTA